MVHMLDGNDLLAVTLRNKIGTTAHKAIKCSVPGVLVTAIKLQGISVD